MYTTVWFSNLHNYLTHHYIIKHELDSNDDDDILLHLVKEDKDKDKDTENENVPK